MVTVLPMEKVGREAMAYHHASYGRCASVRRVPVLMTPGKWSVGSTLLRPVTLLCRGEKSSSLVLRCPYAGASRGDVPPRGAVESARHTGCVFLDLNKIAGMAPC